MFENSSGFSGGGDAVYGSQQGYQTRNRGRGRPEAQEERYVEGDLFGNSKRASFRSSDPPPGQPTRPAYYEGSGFSAFRSGGAGGGQPQAPAAQASPFARGPTHPNGFMMPPATGGGVMGGGAGAGPGRGYGQASTVGVGGVRGGGLSGGDMGYGGEVALVPVDSTSSSRLMGDDDDDDMPTRSLADSDSHDVRDDVMGRGGLRQRRGGGGGHGYVRAAGAVNAEPEEQRATWVVVWGVPPGKSNDVLSSFLQFGQIEEQRGAPDSNWLYFKYATRLQAEKALAAGHGSRLTETVMLGVQRINEDEVWQALREGRIPPLAAGQPVLGRETSRGTAGRGRSSNASRPDGGPTQVDDADLLNAPPQRPRGDGVCRKVMGFFGFY